MRVPTSSSRHSMTRFKRRVLLAMALCAALSGCPVSQPVATHWIGINDAPAGCVNPEVCVCPPPVHNANDWVVSRLFKFFPQAGMKPVDLPPNLMQYCLYEWRHPLPNLPQTPPDPDPALVRDLDEDRPVIAAQSGPYDALANTLRQEQHAAFIPAARGFAGPLPGLAVDRTAMALLDTAPDNATGPPSVLPPATPGHSDHAFVMGWLFHDLVCDGNDCLADIRSWLALPNVDDLHADDVNGGSYGKRSDLATKLFAAVETWKIDAAAGGHPRLVIPLALGWAVDPILAADDSTPTRAVFDTIFHAECHGALVLAAAGNDNGGKQPASGRLFPAAWEESTARPDRAACDRARDLPVFFKDAFLNNQYLAAHPVFGAVNQKLPFVISVGGIDYSDRPIVPTRLRSLKSLVALGSFGGGTTGSIPLPQSRTGTSVAVMVAGAAAAAMWAYAPSLTADEVEYQLFVTRQTVPLIPLAQNLCVSSSCASIGRLSYCHSLQYACQHGVCTSFPNCVHQAETRANPPLSPFFTNQLSTATWTPVTASSTTANPWAQYTGAGAPPWDTPQPTKPGCTICGLDIANQRLYGALDSSVQLANLTLVVGGQMFLINGGNTPFTVQFNGIPSNANTAWLTWTTGTGPTVSAQEQIPLF